VKISELAAMSKIVTYLATAPIDPRCRVRAELRVLDVLVWAHDAEIVGVKPLRPLATIALKSYIRHVINRPLTGPRFGNRR
jgi:hypothetical protein